LHAAESLGLLAKCRIARTTSRDADAEIHGMPRRWHPAEGS
jgi:hypothetical protein